MRRLRMLSLFSGIGGIDLAAQWAGIETVAFCERDEFCQKVLRKHWPNVPIFEDIRTLNKEVLDREGIGRIDLVAGGYPCQPYSLSGERKGEEDDRALWPEMFRIIQETGPAWAIGENVVGHVTLGLDDTLSDMESIGYSTQPYIISARSIGAVHERERVFIIANSNCESMERGSKKKIQREQLLQGEFYSRSIEEWSRRCSIYEPKLSRTHNGIPNQMDRIKSLGNTVVPQQIYPIFKAIAEIEYEQMV